MTEHFLELTPYSPIRTGDLKPRRDYLDTRSYIPGSVLRGALAEWLKAKGETAKIAPLAQSMRFGNFFPAPVGGVYALPFPMTALECKRNGGFRNVPREEYRKAGHGIRDSLLITLAYAELENLGAHFPVPMLLRCTTRNGKSELCGGRMERVGGFYVHRREGWEKVSVSQGVQTKVALSRHRRAAEEGMLYRVVALRPRGVFVGRIWTEEEEAIHTLKEAVGKVGVGALTTRGFGQARLREIDAALPSVQERLQGFNRALRETWQELAELARATGSNVPAEPSGTYFSVDLLSPAVLCTTQGLPTLKLELCLGGKLLEPVFWATQPIFVGGFSTAWGLPKPTALGAAQGSVYVFRVEGNEEALLPELEELETRGVGESTDGGWGEILVCHPFHREVKPV